MLIMSDKRQPALLLFLLWSVALAGMPVRAESAPEGSAAPAPAFAKLIGKWARPDGGYVITISGVGAEGKLDANYANPARLPFSKSEASRDDDQIRLFFELVAGGYNGSTYTLAYDPASDTLHGIYYQAVVKQSFDVRFARSK